ncbi:LURP-one-related family protein [Glycomyces harbinensis]|uniref:Scramblase n=1 Tax=Glycomyces harbinensis TaxID=58114 RepID=A0A1G6ZKE9_9ACTN|nr:LURP-one-related family protein [Glycomyces harbinensis]SDE03129.1 hypothetical protein SAMN05216270_11161 [Glycomyces harbinensis]
MAEEFGLEQVQAMLAEAKVQAVGVGDGTLFGEPVLAFAQLQTAENEGFRHAWARPDGRIVAWANEKRLGPGPGVDDASLRELVDHQKTDVAAVTDRDGATLLEAKHLKHWKSRVTVTDAHGREVGTIRQKSVTFKPSWELSVGDRSYGRVRADGSRALGLDIADASGAVYGRMTKVGSPQYLARHYHAGMAAGLPPATAAMLNRFVIQFFRRPDHLQLAPLIPLAVDLSMAGNSPSKLR